MLREAHGSVSLHGESDKEDEREDVGRNEGETAVAGAAHEAANLGEERADEQGTSYAAEEVG